MVYFQYIACSLLFVKFQEQITQVLNMFCLITNINIFILEVGAFVSLLFRFCLSACLLCACLTNYTACVIFSILFLLSLCWSIYHMFAYLHFNFACIQHGVEFLFGQFNTLGGKNNQSTPYITDYMCLNHN